MNSESPFGGYITPPTPPEGAAKDQGLGWAGMLGGLGLFGAMAGLGLGRTKKPKTKIQRACAESQRLSDLARALEDMLADGQVLLGTEGQGTLSTFNAEVNEIVGKIVLLRRRALLIRTKVHAMAFPKLKKDVAKFEAAIAASEKEVEAILALPDVSPEEELLVKNKGLVVQALSIPGGPHALDAVVKATNLPVEQVKDALKDLLLSEVVTSKLTKEKDEAVANQDFGIAAELRQKRDKIDADDKFELTGRQAKEVEED